MGNYLSLHFDFTGIDATRRVIEPLFESSFFEPVAVGGIARRDERPCWFLGGYALEDFVCRFLDKEGDPPRAGEIVLSTKSITGERDHYGDGAASATRSYLSALAERITLGGISYQDLSPFERKDQTTCVTYLQQVRLDTSVLEETQKWLQANPFGVLYVYGSLRVAVKRKDMLPWQRAFRFYYPSHISKDDAPTPLLLFRVRRLPHSSHIVSANLYTQSVIWLPGQTTDLNGMVGQQEADQNLAELVRLAQAIDRSAGLRPSARLDFEGKTYNKELSRLALAFSSLLRSNN
jgi:hypothetical protein